MTFLQFLMIFPIVLIHEYVEQTRVFEIFHHIFEGFHHIDAFFIFVVFDGFPNSTDG